MRTKHLVSALCLLTLGAFALPLMRAMVALAPPPPLPPGIAVPEPSATPFDPDVDEKDSNAAGESSPAPTDPEEDASTGRNFEKR